MEGQEEGPEDVPELEKLEEVEVPPRRWVEVNPRIRKRKEQFSNRLIMVRHHKFF